MLGLVVEILRIVEMDKELLREMSEGPLILGFARFVE